MGQINALDILETIGILNTNLLLVFGGARDEELAVPRELAEGDRAAVQVADLFLEEGVLEVFQVEVVVS